jgi:putative ABC transport system ATP-binding protein
MTLALQEVTKEYPGGVRALDRVSLRVDDGDRVRVQAFFLIEGMSALENVAQGLLYSATPLERRTAAARVALERVGLGQRLHHRPEQLSGGEQQRVAIARAVVARPAIVFADEPTGNLDSRSGAEVLALLRELNAQGTTVMVITHERDIAEALPRRIALRDGRVVAR